MVNGMLRRTAGKSVHYAGELVVPEPLVVSSPHQSPGCGDSRFRSVQSMTIPLYVWSASTSPAHSSIKSE